MLTNDLNVCVYYATIDLFEDSGLYDFLYGKLSSKRRERVDRFLRSKDKKCSILSELLLKLALIENGVDLDICNAPNLIYSKRGKPYLVNNEIFFNISHSDNLVICGISKNDIGCDVEKVATPDLKVGERFFHFRESAYIDKGESLDEKTDRFYRLWTLKESYIKMTGEGLSTPLDSFYVDSEEGFVYRALETGECVKEDCAIFEYDGFEDYKCSLCAKVKEIKPRFVSVCKDDLLEL